MTLRLGARGSALSRAQAGLVARALEGVAEIEEVTVRTTGDRLSAAGSPIGWKGDFTRELDEALRGGRIDFAVHSLKDVPAEPVEGLVLAAVPEREDPCDVLISRSGGGLADLPPGSRVGTSSPRRRAQILAARPDLEILDARGNVDTRLRRLAEGRWDALVLARAGLARLGRLEAVTEVLDTSVMLPAPGQGALALVAREGDEDVLRVLGTLDHGDSHTAVRAERALLRRLEAGCRAPLAALGRVSGSRLTLSAAVFSMDGRDAIRARGEDDARDASALGVRLAADLLARGAATLMSQDGT